VNQVGRQKKAHVREGASASFFLPMCPHQQGSVSCTDASTSQTAAAYVASTFAAALPPRIPGNPPAGKGPMRATLRSKSRSRVPCMPMGQASLADGNLDGSLQILIHAKSCWLRDPPGKNVRRSSQHSPSPIPARAPTPSFPLSPISRIRIEGTHAQILGPGSGR
jgi:hypothetical protein